LIFLFERIFKTEEELLDLQRGPERERLEGELRHLMARVKCEIHNVPLENKRFLLRYFEWLTQ